IDASRRACVVDGHSVAEGEIISIDGHTGKVYAGEVELQVERPTDCIDLIKDWRVPVPTP
ncbi:MAG TPA: hypothetical protein VMV45_05155, partial [Casimicrobiaceae bacterium]|nr:hypothetical protein [Casimicrobiaceae bacterium]